MNFWEYNKTIALKVSTLLLCVLLMTTSSCKKDLSIYEINEVHVSNSNIDKNGLKKDIEFVSQAYSDLFEKPISGGALEEAIIAFNAIGDRDLVRDMMIRDLLNKSTLSLPDRTTINADVDLFVNKTYKKFYKRLPAPFELFSLRNMIIQNQDMQAKEIYYAFMTANEYNYF